MLLSFVVHLFIFFIITWPLHTLVFTVLRKSLSSECWMYLLIVHYVHYMRRKPSLNVKTFPIISWPFYTCVWHGKEISIWWNAVLIYFILLILCPLHRMKNFLDCWNLHHFMSIRKKNLYPRIKKCPKSSIYHFELKTLDVKILLFAFCSVECCFIGHELLPLNSYFNTCA